MTRRTCGTYGSARPARMRDSTSLSRPSLIRPPWPGAAMSVLGRPGRCSGVAGVDQPHQQPVGLEQVHVGSSRGAVPPFRAVRFPGPRLRTGRAPSTHPALHQPFRSATRPSCRPLGPWREDVCRPVAVATDRDRARVEQRHLPVGRPPPGQVAPPELLPVAAGVLAAQPAITRRQTKARR